MVYISIIDLCAHAPRSKEFASASDGQPDEDQDEQPPPLYLHSAASTIPPHRSPRILAVFSQLPRWSRANIMSLRIRADNSPILTQLTLSHRLPLLGLLQPTPASVLLHLLRNTPPTTTTTTTSLLLMPHCLEWVASHTFIIMVIIRFLPNYYSRSKEICRQRIEPERSRCISSGTAPSPQGCPSRFQPEVQQGFSLGPCHHPHQVLGDDTTTASDEARAGRKWYCPPSPVRYF